MWVGNRPIKIKEFPKKLPGNALGNQLYYFMPLNVFIPFTKDGNLSYLNYIVYVGVKEKIVIV